VFGGARWDFPRPFAMARVRVSAFAASSVDWSALEWDFVGSIEVEPVPGRVLVWEKETDEE